MNIEELLNEVVFNLWTYQDQLINYDNHKILVTEIPEDENCEYEVPTCETLLRITIDDEDTYYVQVANRLFAFEDEVLPLFEIDEDGEYIWTDNWMEF